MESQQMALHSTSVNRVYLLRHAHSGMANPGQGDFDRTLDDRGYAEAEIVADKAADKGYCPQVILCSTAVRCRQTSDAIRRSLPGEPEITFIDEMYNASEQTYLDLISSQSESQSVMLIGHNPTIADLLESLVGEDDFHSHLPSGFPTAGLAVLSCDASDEASPLKWKVVDFIAP